MAPPDRKEIVMNQGGYVTLVGFVATEPRIRFLNDGTPVASAGDWKYGCVWRVSGPDFVGAWWCA
jgi:hypothetical protein